MIGRSAELVFALPFGLSMDFEVFLIGRMREEWLRRGDHEDAVTTGLARTARPIMASALARTGFEPTALPGFLDLILPRVRID